MCCAPSWEANRIKIVYDKKKGCWTADGQTIPKWTPEEMSFANKLRKKIKEKTMLNDEQKNVVIKELKINLEMLNHAKNILIRKVSESGEELAAVLKKIDEIDDVLESMSESDNDD